VELRPVWLDFSPYAARLMIMVIDKILATIETNC